MNYFKTISWALISMSVATSCRPTQMGLKEPTKAPTDSQVAPVPVDDQSVKSEVPDDASGQMPYDAPTDDALLLSNSDPTTLPSLGTLTTNDDIELANERPVVPPGANGLKLPNGAQDPSYFKNYSQTDGDEGSSIGDLAHSASAVNGEKSLQAKDTGRSHDDEDCSSWSTCPRPGSVLLRSPKGEVNIEGLKLSWSSERDSESYRYYVDDVLTGRRVISRGTSVTTATVNGLETNRAYKWSVRGENRWYSGSYASPVTFIPKYLPKPIEPTGLLQDLFVTLKWNALPNVVSWEIEVNNVTEKRDREVYVSSHPDLTFTTPRLKPGHEYNWRVRGTDADGVTSLFSVKQKFFPGMALPIDLKAPITNSRPTLSWKGAQSATSYEVRVDNLTQRKQSIFNPKDVTGTEYRIPTPLIQNHLYRWWVRAKFDDGAVGAWSPASNFKLAPLPAPQGLDPDSLKTPLVNLRPELTWKAVSGASTYEVRVDNATTRTKNVLTSKDVSGVSWVVSSDLVAGHRYTWWVRALDDSGVAGVWSKAANFQVQSIGVPFLSQPTGTITSRLATFKWNPSFLAAWYELRVDNLSTREKGVIHVNRITNISYFADNVMLRPNSTYAVYLRSWTKDGLAGLWSKAYQFKVGVQGSAMMQQPVDVIQLTAGSSRQLELAFLSSPSGVKLTTRVDTWVSVLDERMRFCTDGNYRFNSGKLQEKWIRSAGCTGPWHYILPNGDVMERTGSRGTTGRLVTRVAADVYATPDLLDTASPRSVLVEAASLDDRLRLCLDSSKRDNSGRRQERWVRGNDCNGPWYFIIPEGLLYQWNNAPGVASGTFAGGLHPSIWSKPARLHTSSPAPVLPSVTVSGTTLTITAPADARGDYGVVVSGVRGADNDSVIIPVRIN
jgi:hypothetical protein